MSLLIRNVQIIDGKGRPPFKGDVLIEDDTIVSVGKVRFHRSGEIIDGAGNYLAPGFIDAHAASDHHLDLLNNPAQKDLVDQGVTTIIGGHSGVSLAPMFFGSLDLFNRWTEPNQININWHTYTEFVRTLETYDLGVNFGMFAGHASMRSEITHMIERDLTRNEMDVFKKIVNDTLNEGVLGLSTGLEYIHGRYSSPEELKTLASIVAGHGGVYSTQLRSATYQLSGAIKEAIDIANEIDVKTMISWFQPLEGFAESYGEAISEIHTQTQPDKFFFAVFPHQYSLRPIYALLPSWAQERSAQVMLDKISRPNALVRLEQSLQGINPEDIQIASAWKNDFLVGKTVADIADTHKLSPPRALLKLMQMTNLRATVFYKNINKKMLVSMLRDERSLIVSNSHSPLIYEEHKHERHKNTFPKFIALMLTEGYLPIEEIIRKITARPATFLGIADRGTIEPKKRADLVLLDRNDHSVVRTFVGGTTGKGAIIHRQKND
jgi:N-acyl-D-amino-acid deacylase